jgi:hypothetical protein
MRAPRAQRIAAGRGTMAKHYLEEFVFRFNRCTSRSSGLVFYRLLEQGVQAEPITIAIS